ncbi:phage shock protein PspC (stress-responsive transcriptional regulator) [Dyadobacter jejuensis]|uniref:Phage shock protein PspC (Stress-responsive transcriptional regulator) n=1 Tax=Dyadobacter jejuensis TaxID=1082580 RepID=A0A316B392_9BACT|nr:PspC domain-containing protein [Dyadobacter jejuensis]PWJ57027.1 phage shock protein PspC (stress-responsive transcriptional regulator) [Dyadobacter jejuensis]
MNNNKLYRNTHQKILGGVASGLADYFNIDTVFIRVLFVLGIFIPAPLPIVIVYIAFWILMPDIAKKPKELTEHTCGGI